MSKFWIRPNNSPYRRIVCMCNCFDANPFFFFSVKKKKKKGKEKGKEKGKNIKKVNVMYRLMIR